jgi:hypothetical protein
MSLRQRRKRGRLRRARIRAQANCRDFVGGEEQMPVGQAGTRCGVATDIKTADVVEVDHPDGGVAVVVEQEDFELRLVGCDGANFP